MARKPRTMDGSAKRRRLAATTFRKLPTRAARTRLGDHSRDGAQLIVRREGRAFDEPPEVGILIDQRLVLEKLGLRRVDRTFVASKLEEGLGVAFGDPGNRRGGLCHGRSLLFLSGFPHPPVASRRLVGTVQKKVANAGNLPLPDRDEGSSSTGFPAPQQSGGPKRGFTAWFTRGGSGRHQPKAGPRQAPATTRLTRSHSQLPKVEASGQDRDQAPEGDEDPPRPASSA